MAYAVNARGFTLVETLVALLVITVAYAGVTTAVGRFVDQRHLLIERHTGHRIAWNRLLEEYRMLHWPQGSNPSGQTAVVAAAGGRWRWQLEQDQAQGRGLTRYRVDVFDANGDDRERPVSSLTAFWGR